MAGQGSQGGIHFGVLGELEAERDGARLALGPFKQRVVLALLLCNPNNIVPVGRITEALWGDDLPRAAAKNLQVYISNLRRLLFGDDQAKQLTYRPPGYQLRVRPDELDLLRFEGDAREGRTLLRAGDMAGAARTLRRALAAWRADALTELRSVQLVETEAARLDNRRLSAYEDWIEAELALGHSRGLLDVIEELASQNPMRERLRSAQMLALHRSGRSAEALARYDELRQLLARELGLQPSPALARLYQAILAEEPSLRVPRLPHPRSAPADVAAHIMQLPRDLEDFTGRGRETESLTRALGVDASHVVVVSGAPGVGKTALAVHAAHMLGGQFPDGRLVVSMRSADGRPRAASAILAELLGAFGLDERLPRGQETRAALYRAWLAERQLLIILDDATDEPHVRPLLPGTGGSRTLITSRRHLGALEGARHLEVGPMSMADAVDLLTRVSRQAVAEDRPAAERITRACGLVPYAIRICGAKLEASPHHSLLRLADRLTQDQHVLDELSIGDLTIRTCARAYERDLTAAERDVAWRLGALPKDSFTLAELAGLLGSTKETAEAHADRLIESRFVTPTGPAGANGHHTYEIHRWLRLYLRERSGTPARGQAVTRLAA